MSLYSQHSTSQTALKPSEIIFEALSTGELKPEDVNVKLSDVEVEDYQLDRHSSSSAGDDHDGNLNKDEKEEDKDIDDDDDDDDGADDGDDRSESEFVNENLDYTGPEMVSDYIYIYIYILIF